MFSSNDKKQLAERGIPEDTVQRQLERFKIGFQPISLFKAATVENGILRLSAAEEEEAISSFDGLEGSMAKFVPASGAATRMFKELYAFLGDENSPEEEVDLTKEEEGVFAFFSNLHLFAFYEDLNEALKKSLGTSIDLALENKKYKLILETLLNKNGLGYGNLPKGLLAFHKYDAGSRTPAIEQLREGLLHTPTKGAVNLHFTVSPEFISKFESHINSNRPVGEQEVEVSYSSQEPKTDTIAVDLSNEAFRDKENRLLFRPAGHGALLKNLNEVEADIVFIKNIDNVLPDHLKAEVVKFKKVLAGLLTKYQEKTHKLLERHEKNEEIEDEAKGLLEELGVKGNLSVNELVEKLNRPIRVCGMVKNVGEPGGGPFWINEANGQTTLQIVEKAQVDLDDEKQLEIFEKSTHFNPVDIVCGLKNFQGEKFDLLKYRDEETGFITEKSVGGRSLKAMELPGLWNGSMADWNTVFVEVPLSTFSPVKTVNDLLKKEHQPKG